MLAAWWQDQPCQSLAASRLPKFPQCYLPLQWLPHPSLLPGFSAGNSKLQILTNVWLSVCLLPCHIPAAVTFWGDCPLSSVSPPGALAVAATLADFWEGALDQEKPEAKGWVCVSCFSQLIPCLTGELSRRSGQSGVSLTAQSGQDNLSHPVSAPGAKPEGQCTRWRIVLEFLHPTPAAMHMSAVLSCLLPLCFPTGHGWRALNTELILPTPESVVRGLQAHLPPFL